MSEEYKSIMNNDVWDVVPRPQKNRLSPLSGSTKSSMELMEVQKSSRVAFLLEASLKRKM